MTAITGNIEELLARHADSWVVPVVKSVSGDLSILSLVHNETIIFNCDNRRVRYRVLYKAFSDDGHKVTLQLALDRLLDARE